MSPSQKRLAFLSIFIASFIFILVITFIFTFNSKFEGEPTVSPKETTIMTDRWMHRKYRLVMYTTTVIPVRAVTSIEKEGKHKGLESTEITDDVYIMYLSHGDGWIKFKSDPSHYDVSFPYIVPENIDDISPGAEIRGTSLSFMTTNKHQLIQFSIVDSDDESITIHPTWLGTDEWHGLAKMFGANKEKEQGDIQ